MGNTLSVSSGNRKRRPPLRGNDPVLLCTRAASACTLVIVRHRTVKQIIIALIVGSVIGGIATLVVIITRKPPPAPTATPPSVRALEAGSTTIIRHSRGKGDVVGVLKNPNGNAGAVKVKYELVLREKETVLRAIRGETYVLPGRQKYVTALNEDIPTESVSAVLRVEQPEWTFVGDDFVAPSIVLIDRKTQVISGIPATYEVKGLLKNQADVDFLKVEVTVLGLNARDEIVGISNTFAGSLRALESREFTAQWPLPSGEAVQSLQVLPDVNVFSADAVERREGSLTNRDLPSGADKSPRPKP